MDGSVRFSLSLFPLSLYVGVCMCVYVRLCLHVRVPSREHEEERHAQTSIEVAETKEKLKSEMKWETPKAKRSKKERRLEARKPTALNKERQKGKEGTRQSRHSVYKEQNKTNGGKRETPCPWVDPQMDKSISTVVEGKETTWRH